MALLLVDCFIPKLPPTVACGAMGECPPDLRCETAVQLCVTPSTPPVTALVFKTRLTAVEAQTERFAVKVALVDAGGAVVPLSGGNFALTLAPNRRPLVLGGRLAAAAVDGVATFEDVQFDSFATGVHLISSSGPLTATSLPFDVTPTRPVVSALMPPAALEGCASLDYTLGQAQSLPVDLLVEVDPDDDGPLPFVRATQAASAPGLAGVQGAPSAKLGRRNAFAWNSTADMPGVDANVRIRVTPTARGVRGDPVLSDLLHVTNGPRFIPNPTSSQVAITQSALADMDLDGWPDLVIASQTVVTIRLGGNDAGVTSIPTPGNPSPWRLAIGDFNGDGLPDLAIGSGEIAVALQQRGPSGTFLPFRIVRSVDFVLALAVADFDRDGLDDLAVLEAHPNGTESPPTSVVQVLRQRRSSSVDLVLDSTPYDGDFARSIAAGDLDRDGWPDLVVGVAIGRPGVVVHRIAAGFATPVALDGITGEHIAVADLDEDGFGDIAALDTDGLHVYSGKSGAKVGFPDVMGSALAIGDLNGDGLGDLVVDDGNKLFLHEHGARGTLAFQPGRKIGTTPGAVTVAPLAISDENLDGRNDLVALLSDGEVWTYFNTMARRCDAGPSGPRGVQVEGGGFYVFPDLNADGKPDLVARSWQVPVAFGRGDGTFVEGVAAFQSLYPPDIAAGDFDGDGLDDLACVDDRHGVAMIQYNDPAAPGTFQRVEIPTPLVPIGMALEDLDRDGATDLLLMGSSRIEVHRGDPDSPRAFLAPTSLHATVETDSNACPYRFSLCAVEVHDLDADGWPDIISVTDGHVRVFRQDPQHPGTFADAILLEGPRSQLVGVANVVGDATPELVLLEHPDDLSSATTVVAHRLDVGTGSLGVAWSLFLGDVYAQGKIVDLDGDGSAELLLSTSETSMTLFSPRDVPSGTSVPLGRTMDLSWVGDVQFADLNGDARLDLVTDDPTTYLVAMGVAGPTAFDTGSSLGSLGAGSGHVTLGDFSGDTLPDLAAISASGVGVRLVRQSSTRPGELEPTETTLPGSTYVALADLQGDGFADVITEGTEGHLTFASHGDDVFTPECPLVPSLGPVAVGDLDADGYPDVIGADQFNTQVVHSPGSSCRPATAAFTLAQPLSYGDPVSMDILDMNRDGVLDVVTVIDGIRVALQSSGPSTSFAINDYEMYDSASLSVRPYIDAKVADLDHDGLPDVIALATHPTWQLIVLRGNPANPGTLLPSEIITSTSGRPALAVGDLDGDGWNDIVLAGDGGTSVYVHDPTQPTHLVYAYSVSGLRGGSGGSLAIADFDADGHQDLLVTSADGGTTLIRGR